jgi:hypothetical protein
MRLWIKPLERKTKPRTVFLQRVIVDNDAYTGSRLMHPGDLSRIGFPAHSEVTCFIVTDTGLRDATGHKVIPTFVPNAFPTIKEILRSRSAQHEISQLFMGLSLQEALRT